MRIVGTGLFDGDRGTIGIVGVCGADIERSRAVAGFEGGARWLGLGEQCLVGARWT
jgi:hypothetical protein